MQTLMVPYSELLSRQPPSGIPGFREFHVTSRRSHYGLPSE